MKTSNHNPAWKLITLIAAFCLALVSLPTKASEEATVAELVNQRLALMKSVAAYKWVNQLPIEDLEREAVVIASAQQSGLSHGLTYASSERFFALQIKAAKEIQQYWFNQWQLGNAPQSAPDLVGEIRPELLTLGRAITAQLITAKDSTQGPIQALGLSKQTSQEIARAIKNIEQYQSRLHQVLDTGVLRVGTTWDYKPFSHGDKASAKGIDITLAQDLAKSLGAEVQFVTTSWPTLMADFQQGKFDIGMSGISINLNRSRTAFFSAPYHIGGKTPITRCEDADRFKSLADIDQGNVRVIVNPGGTNQRFVDANIKRANIIVHDDNRTIFHEILKQRADVMFTDAIEVAVQTALHDGLCRPIDETLTFQQKGFLLPQDHHWKHYVDTWLAQRQGDGTLANIFEANLGQ